MIENKNVIGIDLASSQSVVAVIDETGTPEVIQNAEGSRLTPSVILFDDDGTIKIGKTAKNKAVVMPKNTVTLIKRFMGGTYDSENIQKAIKNATFNVVDKNNKPYVEIDGKLHSAEELSSMIIAKLKKCAEDYYGTEVKQAVITCPALYDNVQREAVKLAGELAGLEVLRVINEPTAAILAMPGLDMTKDRNILVVDLGGSTLDFSMCEISSEVVEVKASYGNTYHGGADYDKRIVDHLLEQFKKENPDIELDAPSLSRFKEEAENAKCALSNVNTTQTDIMLPYVGDGKKFANFQYTLTRATYDRLVDDLVQEVIRCGRECVKKSGVAREDIDEILLVGGMTRCLNIRDALSKEFNCPLNNSVNPDEAVAKGAAKQAYNLVGGKKGEGMLLLDVTPISLGIETLGNAMTVMIPANTTIPTKKKEIFSTAADNQTAVTIKVFQGERQFASDNKLIGEFILDGIVPARRGVPQIEVTFDMDANGILHVSSEDLATHKTKDITITSSNGLSKEEIERIKADAEQNREADEKRKAALDELNSAEAVALQVRDMIENESIKEKLSEDEISGLKTKMDAIFKAVDEKDNAQAKTLSEELLKETQAISARLYGANNGAGAGQGASFMDDFMNQARNMGANAAGAGASEQPSATDTTGATNVDFEEVK